VPERIAFARSIVETTDRAFTGVTSDRAIARSVRLNIVPAVAPAVFSFRAARRFMFRIDLQIRKIHEEAALAA